MERARKKEGGSWCAVKGITQIMSSFTHLMLFQTCWGFFFLQTTKADTLKNVSVHTIKLKSMGSKTILDLTQLFYAQKKHTSKFYRRKDVKQV